MAFAFEKLLVYQKAIDFSDAVCSKSEGFPRGYGFLIEQLNRAALSIAAKIAEGMYVSPRLNARISSALLAARCKNAFRCWNWQCEAD